MARLACLTLEQRVADWNEAPSTLACGVIASTGNPEYLARLSAAPDVKPGLGIRRP